MLLETTERVIPPVQPHELGSLIVPLLIGAISQTFNITYAYMTVGLL